MSVINDVLKELQNRESRFTPLELAGDGVARRPVARRPWLLPALLLPLLLLAGAWYYQARHGSAPTPGAAALAGAAPAQSAASAESAPREDRPAPATAEIASTAAFNPAADTGAEPAPPDNAIIGLQLREAADELRIEFALRERAVAYLRQRDENGFVYHLGSVENRIAAPDISDNRWLERLALAASGDGVDIRFVTAPGVLVDTSLARGDGDFVWAISLRHSPPPVAASEAPAPTPATAPTREAVRPPPTAEAAAGPSVAAPARAGGQEIAADGTPGADPAVADTAAADTAEVRLDIRSSAPGSPASDSLASAREMIAAGRAAEAERLLRDLLGSAQDYEARRQLLALYNARQQVQRVALLARDSAARYPGDGGFVTEYARSLFQGGEYLGVIRLLGAQETLDARQHSLLGVSYQRLDRHGDAIRHFRLGLAADDAQARSWIGLGISLEQAAAPAEALDSYQRALALGDLNQRLQDFARTRSSNLRRLLN